MTVDVRTWRRARGWRVSDVAAAAGMAPDTIYRVERLDAPGVPAAVLALVTRLDGPEAARRLAEGHTAARRARAEALLREAVGGVADGGAVRLVQ